MTLLMDKGDNFKKLVRRFKLAATIVSLEIIFGWRFR